MNMTNKVAAIFWALITGFFGFIAWLAAVPPEQQSGLLGSLVLLFPLDWQPTIALWSKSIATFSGIWAAYKAAQSGPQTPPTNSPKA